jgi:hypothetical protein
MCENSEFLPNGNLFMQAKQMQTIIAVGLKID